jgi:peptidoglycan-associated lipoprotein
MKMTTFLIMSLLATTAACSKKGAATTAETTPRPGAADRGERAPAASGQDSATVSADAGDGDTASFTAVYFELDAVELSEEGRAELQRLAAWLERRPAATVTVEGHADARGTTEYNVALGQRRAQAMQQFLIDLGVSRQRVKTISFGEERPAVNGDGESAWALNRRGELRPAP